METKFTTKLKGSECDDCKIFAKTVEPSAIEVVQNMLNLAPAKGTKIRCMPDIHYASPTCVVGLSLEFPKNINIHKDLVIDPSWIGNDVGCGMLTTFIKLTKPIEYRICEKANDKLVKVFIQKENQLYVYEQERIAMMNSILNRIVENFKICDQQLIDDIWANTKDFKKFCDRIGANRDYVISQLGTIGAGNHYFEVGCDINDPTVLALTVHTGSRNLGERLYKHYSQYISDRIAIKDQEKINAEISELRAKVPNMSVEEKTCIKAKIDEIISSNTRYEDHTFLSGELAYQYLVDQLTVVCYAQLNREICMETARFALMSTLFDNNIQMSILPSYKISDSHLLFTVNSIHNYVDPYSIHKGSISAMEDEWAIIPFNMRDGIALVRGKGNEDWNCSAPHGAGRILSRKAAKNLLNLEDVKKEMSRVVTTTLDEDTIDEAPDAYKSRDEILDMIKPTVDVIAIFKPLINIKEKEKPFEM